MDREILPQLDNFIGQGFDKICAGIFGYLVERGGIKMNYDAAGRWWGGNEEIDLVGIEGDTPVFAAECKWSRKPIGIDILRDLKRKVSLLASGAQSPDIRLGLFARTGFTKEIEELGRKGEVELIDIRKTRL